MFGLCGFDRRRTGYRRATPEDAAAFEQRDHDGIFVEGMVACPEQQQGR